MFILHIWPILLAEILSATAMAPYTSAINFSSISSITIPVEKISKQISQEVSNSGLMDDE